MTQKILPIVEGESEVGGLPVILRRLLQRLLRPEVLVDKPFRVKRLQVVKPGELEHSLNLGIRRREAITMVLVVLDADDDEPSSLEQSLFTRCREVTSLPVGVVLARRELEAWFLGSKDSLRGICGIREDANAPEGPETIRGAKERLTRNMMGKRRYLEVDDLPVMAAKMDLDLALQRCFSFRKLLTELERLLAETA
jgi:hypothetical protein